MGAARRAGNHFNCAITFLQDTALFFHLFPIFKPHILNSNLTYLEHKEREHMYTSRLLFHLQCILFRFVFQMSIGRPTMVYQSR